VTFARAHGEEAAGADRDREMKLYQLFLVGCSWSPVISNLEQKKTGRLTLPVASTGKLTFDLAEERYRRARRFR